MIFEFIFSANFCIAVISILLAYVVIYYVRAYSDIYTGKVPPGPIGIPIAGMLPFLRPDRHNHITELNAKYGPIMQMQVGSETHIYISDAATVLALFKNPALNGRVDRTMESMIKYGWGMFFRDSDAQWRVSRKIGVKAMTLLSSSKSSKVIDAVVESMDTVKAQLAKLEGQPLEIRDHIFNITGSAMTSLCFGLKADLEDPDTAHMFNYVSQQLIMDLAALLPLNDFPVLRPLYTKELRRQDDGLRAFTDFAVALLDRHSFDGEVRNIADAVKKAAAEAAEEGDVSREDIRKVALDIYSAGMFDPAENVAWATLLLASSPAAQKRLYEEILATTGGDRDVDERDQASMPFTSAVLLETLRYSANNPFNLAHRTTAPVQLNGFTIPTGVNVFANVFAMHRDPKVFPQPDKFVPERFMREDGSLNAELGTKLIGFGAGGRRCIGEQFAKQQMFVVLVGLFRDFSVELDPETTGNPLTPVFNFTLSPSPHKLILRKRK